MRLARPHRRIVSPAEARALQESWRRRIRPAAPFPLEDFLRRGIVLAVDVAYSAKTRLCHAALVVWSVPERRALATLARSEPAVFPYVPGLLAFREIPPLIPLFRSVRPPAEALPLILCDGQGIAHPRRFGLATHLGRLYETPSLGWAKTRLVGEHDEPPLEAGGASPLIDRGERVGWAFRSRTGCAPTFVSPGVGMDPDEALAIARSLRGERRLCEPARLAHAATGAAMRAVEGPARGAPADA